MSDAATTDRAEAVQRELRERVLIELARRHPRYLGEVCFTIDRNGPDGRPLPMIPEPFHQEWLEAALREREVLILAARGHAKSEWFSAVLPAWFIGKKPTTRVVHVTCTDALASMYSRRMQELMVNPTYRRVFPDLPRPGKKWTESEWQLSIPGRRDPTWRCAGRGGALTGGRADIIIADDASTLETCRTPGERDRTWEWFTKTLMPMLVPGGRLFVLGTPYNEDDLYQRLRSGGLGGSGRGMAPMVYPAEDAEGKILWPARFPREELDKRRSPPLGTPSSYASQYLCNPVPEEGAMLKREWWRYYDELPDTFDVMIASWDMAFKGADGHDGRSWVVGQVWGRRGIRYYLVDQVRGRWDFVETLDQVRWLSRRWPQVITKVVEAAANGFAVVSALTADERNGVGGLYLRDPKGKHGKDTKESRASAMSPFLRAGNVYVPRSSPWIDGFMHECLAFPNSAFTDQVDAMTQSFGHFMESGDWLPAEDENPDLAYKEAQEAQEQEDFDQAIERMKKLSQQYQRREPSSGWTKTA